VNVIEELADQLYFRSVRELYTTDQEPITIIVWVRIFDCFEKIIDQCENIADMLASVIMKNS
jgi:uncharacterized protein Yka (UPF0111/DUF47 family)